MILKCVIVFNLLLCAMKRLENCFYSNKDVYL
jgi:hypothetical protein